VVQADWILNRLSHMNEIDEPESIAIPDALQLSIHLAAAPGGKTCHPLIIGTMRD